MSRVTAPVSKLARALSSTPVSRAASPLLDTSAHNAGAVLMPKYAELLRNRRALEHSDSARSLTTTHRPTPQPSLANRSKPLMQTFSSSAHASSASLAATISTHLDAAVLPAFSGFDAVAAAAGIPRVPLLPDNYGAAHAVSDDFPVSIPSASIVAANPDNVVPATPLSAVEGIGLDGVDLKFAHEHPAAAAYAEEHSESGMIRDLWKGMVEDIFSPPNPATQKAS